MAATDPRYDHDGERLRREAEGHVAELREKLRRELNWDAQEAQWKFQRWFWVGVVVVASLGIIFR